MRAELGEDRARVIEERRFIADRKDSDLLGESQSGKLPA